MTTNIYDSNNSVMLCDSRWSVDGNQFGKCHVDLYADDTGFEKFEVTNSHVFMFAGNAGLISEWKNFLKFSLGNTQAVLPPLQGIALLAVEKGSDGISHQYGHTIVDQFRADGSRAISSYAGTGGDHAAFAWMQSGGCFKKAVVAALEGDLFSGGCVKEFHTVSGTNNASQCQGLKVLEGAFQKKGMAMYYEVEKSGIKTFLKEVPIAQAASKDPDVQFILNQLASGKAAISAPCDAMHATPSAQDVAALKAFLETVY